MRAARTRLRVRVRDSSIATLAVLALTIGLVPLVSPTSVGAADYTTNSGDNLRTGWYADQTTLTPALVSSGNFGKLFTTPVDGQVYAQPLVSQGTLFVTTENNNIYGLDPVTGATKWPTRNVGTPFNASDIGCADLAPHVGITGTPVVDPATNTAYFVAKSYVSGASGATQFQAHAVDVATGAEKPNFPVTIQGAAGNNPAQTFHPTTENQRPGLLLLDGVIYAGFGSSCDVGPFAGWIAGISTTGQLTTLWSAVGSGKGSGAGIWQGASGLVSDGPGRIILATGNGQVATTLTAPTPGTSPPANLGQAVIRLNVQPDGSLKAGDFFTPYDAVTLDQNDQDLGSGGPVALPSAQFPGTPASPNLMLEIGKQGYLYLLDRDNLGGYQEGSSNGDAVVNRAGPTGGVWGRPGVWGGDGGYVYTVASTGVGAGLSGLMHAFKYGTDGTGKPALIPAGTSADAFGFASGSPVITSSGTTSGTALVWTEWSPDGSGANAQLRAYDPVPVNGTMQLRYTAPIGTSTKFATPGVAGNRLYVGTRDGAVIGFGAPVQSPATAPPVSFPTTVVGQSSVATATFTVSSGISNLVVNGFSSSNADFVVGTPTPALGQALSAGQSVSVPITFSPTKALPESANLTATTNTGAAVTTMSGLGQASTATITAQPQVLSMNGAIVGGAPLTGTITFSNVGATDLTINSVTAPDAPFSVTGLPTVGQVIPATSSITVNVAFASATPGSFTDELALDTTAGGYTVPITANAALPPIMSLSSTSVAFGNVPQGQGGSGSFTITNTGGSTLTISKSKPPALGVGFTATSALPEGATIPAGASVTETVAFAAGALGAQQDGWIINSDDGTGLKTVTFAATSVPAATVPGLTAVGWTTNGTAALTGQNMVLTPNTPGAAGSSFWPGPLPSAYVSASFDANIDSGLGADGLTLTFADPSKGATPGSLGIDGGGLGFSGIPGIAVALDTFQTLANPSPNFIGVTDGPLTPGSDQLHWLATSSNIPNLRNATIHVVVKVANGLLTVSLNGVLALSTAVTLPPQALVGFTAGSGGITDRHAVSNVAITTAAPPSPSLQVSTTVIAPTGSTQAGKTFAYSGTCPNSFTTPAIGSGGVATPVLAGATSGSPCTVTQANPGSGWSTLVSVNGGPLVALTGSTLSAPIFPLVGLPSTVAFTNVYSPPGPPIVPAPTAGGWQLNGSATMSGSSLQITPVKTNVTGSAFWPTPVPTTNLSIAFDANLDSGTGADGLTLALVDPAKGATAKSLGAGSGGLGFGGVPGIAVALDTHKNTPDPSNNFVGIATGAGSAVKTLAWAATTTAVPALRGTTRHVAVSVVNGTLTVRVDGTPVLVKAMTLPPQVLVGFTGSTSASTDRHAVSNVVVSTTTSLLPPVAGNGWQLNGASTLVPPTLQLTPPTNGAAGSAFSPVPVRTGYLRADFDANIDSGTGADGIAMVLGDPTKGATVTSLGVDGGGLGFSGIPGLAIGLVTFKGAGSPSANFVGVSDGGAPPGSNALHWLATNSAVPPLRNATRHVTVILSSGVLTVQVDGSLVLATTVTVPAQALAGFTAGCGGLNDRHAVSNVRISFA